MPMNNKRTETRTTAQTNPLTSKESDDSMPKINVSMHRKIMTPIALVSFFPLKRAFYVGEEVL